MAQDSAFQEFKLNGVETDCVVSRIADDAFWGMPNVSAEGGVPINDEEARTVQLIYDAYLKLRSVTALKQHIDELG